MTRPAPELSPLLVGAALLGAGILLRQVQPTVLSLPARPEVTHRDRGLQRVLRQARDAIASVLPANLTGSIGRTLAIMGGGLILIRILDMAVEEGEELF